MAAPPHDPCLSKKPVSRHSITLLCMVIISPLARSQQLEPRAYAALPKNLNAVVAGYGISKGNVLDDPALPIANFTITTNTILAVYLHTFEVKKRLARIQITLPFAALSGKLQINGHDTSGARNGLGDAGIRLGINLTGSPPLDKREFKRYTQKTIVGASVVILVPTGLYYADKRINIGSNRWAFKPELGLSKRVGRMYLETYSGVWFYTVNSSYLTSKRLSQDPVFNIQVHAAYYFGNMMWVSVNSVWFVGGQTKVDDAPQGALLNNWRAGATWGIPIARGQSLKFQFHIGLFTADQYRYSLATLAYQYVF